ncbi:MAG: purine nucleoside phosphorylase [candidate division Zixibacteria bacterium SM23_81]|nr:MAG: purine nucleoside phosphorylase [candidate division Zixibacteria bacterium SM23_81]
MSKLTEMITETAEFLLSRVKSKSKVGIILGSGLGALGEEIQKEAVISYEEIPYFPVSTVEGHAGRLLFGKLGGKKVVAMQGRFHYYEGYSMQEITFPVRVMRALGAEVLVISNACGGLNPQFKPGDIMIIRDHINLLGINPLLGPNEDELGTRFPDMSEPYDRKLIALTEKVALEEKIKVQKGVYVAMTGPTLETAAEYRFLRTIGADVVGMSTVPEDIVAIHGGMRVLGLSVVTDSCLPDALKPASHKEIIKVAAEAEPKLTKLMKRVIESM